MLVTAARNVLVIGPSDKVKPLIVYPMTTGRNLDEMLRVVDSLQLEVAEAVHSNRSAASRANSGRAVGGRTDTQKGRRP